MKKFFKKYKEAIPFVVVSAVVGSAIMSCIMVAVAGMKNINNKETI